MVHTSSLGELMADQILLNNKTGLNINDRAFTFRNIYKYVLQGTVCDSGFHAFSTYNI